jgi:hypothetical protein
MKISERTIDDLLTLIEHSHRDMSYGGGGSYTSENCEDYNKKDGKKALRAIEFIKKIIKEDKNL